MSDPDAVLVSQPGAGRHARGEPWIGKVGGVAARTEYRPPRRGPERLFDAPAQDETRRPGCGILRQRIAQPRVEDFYVESLQTERRLAHWQHLRDVRYQLPRQHDLGRASEFVQTVIVEERERVGVLTESLVREVRGEEWDSFFLPLRLRVCLEVFGLRRKTDAERPFRQRGDLAEDVGVRGELQVEIAVAALDLVRLGIDWMVIGDRGDRDEDIGLLHPRHHGFEHLARSDHVHALHARRSGERGDTGYQRHLRTCFKRCLRDGVAHLARALIGDPAHRVDRLIGRSRRDQHFFFRKRLWAERTRDFGQYLRWLEHPPHAAFAVRMVTFRRTEDADPIGAQALDVTLRRRVLPHLHVHRGRDHERAAARDVQRREQVVTQAVRKLRETIARSTLVRDYG